MITYPEPILTTERLLLRLPVPGDASALQPLANNYAVAKKLARLPHPYLLHHAESWIACNRTFTSLNEHLFWCIIRQDDQQVIGGVGLDLDWAQRSATLGYWLGEPYWRQGYMSEAAASVINFAWGEPLLCRHILSSAMPENSASRNVLGKLGFVETGMGTTPTLLFGERPSVNFVLYHPDETKPISS